MASEWAYTIAANGVRTVAVVKSNNPRHQQYFKDQVAGNITGIRFLFSRSHFWRAAQLAAASAKRAARIRIVNLNRP